ncbi:uncharacterized protein LOC106176930 [Lingula anatina]|uniref:Uncharacterized protein LOC106176930 n=1 Tax=Lingula anatina TaxID=7574 RepID=A0A1S3JX71_LINAN|nr:uncharacterized protein LOC106176930 [Lingula anatina]|eukprot:XP_013414973.1 uncharacterized protein LOC106176930 [Lingula anatina]
MSGFSRPTSGSTRVEPSRTSVTMLKRMPKGTKETHFCQWSMEKILRKDLVNVNSYCPSNRYILLHQSNDCLIQLNRDPTMILNITNKFHLGSPRVARGAIFWFHNEDTKEKRTMP